MSEAAISLFGALSYKRIDQMIRDGESETIHLECKAPSTPRFARSERIELAKVLSGFSNTDGGVMLYGVATTPKSHSGLDVLTQLEPLARIKEFAAEVSTWIPQLTTPPVLGTNTKIIKQRKTDTRGLLALCIRKHDGDPIRSARDSHFYYHTGTGFNVAPYEMIKRLFGSTASPDLHPLIQTDLVQRTDRDWQVPLILENRSSATASSVIVSIRLKNPNAVESFEATEFTNDSSANPGKTLFSRHVPTMIHRGLNLAVGPIHFRVKERTRTLRISVTLFADGMRARKIGFTLTVPRKASFRAEKTRLEFLY